MGVASLALQSTVPAMRTNMITVAPLDAVPAMRTSMIIVALLDAMLSMRASMFGKENVSAHRAGVVGTEPFCNASTAHDMFARQTYRKFGKTGCCVDCAAVFGADDAFLFLVIFDTVLELEEFTEESIGHGVGLDG